MIKALAIASAVAVCFPVLAEAQSDSKPQTKISDYVILLNEELETHLSGVGNGIESTNMWLRQARSEPIYCPPDNIKITGKQYGQILKNVVAESPMVGDFEVQYVGMALILGLERTFPCSSE